MSKIYTKTGDKGQTSLFDGSRVPKNHIRVQTYGMIDELNSILGLTLVELSSKKYELRIKKEISSIQNDLFEICSFLANPTTHYQIQTTKHFDNQTKHFEELIDEMTSKLPLLNNFILPGGGKTGAQFHVARTIARRVERQVIELSQKEEVEGFIICYFNRLSDLLFTMSRFVNFKEKKKEIIWEKLSSLNQVQFE